MIAVTSSTSQTTRSDRGLALRWGVTVLLGAAICAVPLWLWYVALRTYVLRTDDFDYIARSRSATAFRQHVFTPLNEHVVPLFRIETHVLTVIAGSLEAVPEVFAWASYATLVLAVLLTGHVVARETGRPARGLIAMAAVGFSSVLGPSLLYYAASQALAAGIMILVMLAFFQSWRVRGSWWLLASGLVAAMAAPLFWTAGYSAGPVGAAYLMADGRRWCRRAAALPLAVSPVVFAVMWWITIQPETHRSPFTGATFRIESSVVHTAQAVTETLLFKNFGLDTTTTAAQGLALSAFVAGLWVWAHFRFGPRGPEGWPQFNALEIAGAVLVACSYGMIYSVRGTWSTFDVVRTYGWYDSIPQLGAVLFVSGWWAGRLDSPPPGSLTPPQRQELVIVVFIAAIILLIQEPRVQRVIYRYDGAGASVGPDYLASMPLRTAPELFERAHAQRRELAELDRLEHTVRAQGLDRAGAARVFGRTSIQGMVQFMGGPNALDLLDISEDASPHRHRAHEPLARAAGSP